MNPTGKFELGGPHADCGLTGRKIIVDTYGGMARHGGGAFSGKDPTKVDRSAAYAVRQIAKAVVAAGLAKRCEAQVAYAIGVAHPMSIMVDTFGTSEIAPDKLEAVVREVFDMRPAAIIERLDLRRPIFKRTAAYGHFGRTDGDGFTWENTDAVRRRAAPGGRRSTTDSDPLARACRVAPGRHRGRPRLRLLGSRRARRRWCASARSCASRCTAGACAAGSSPTTSTPRRDGRAARRARGRRPTARPPTSSR